MGWIHSCLNRATKILPLMNSDQPENLVVKRIFLADIDRVFDAWTQPELLAQWFGPEGFMVSKSELDLTVGGKYIIEIISPDNNTIKHFGEYVEVDRPNSLIFTWILDNQQCQGSQQQRVDTLVTLAFKSINDETELTLTHEKLPSKEAFDGHEFGWVSSFNSLEQLLNNP